MAASDTQEGAASAAGRAAREYAPDLQSLLVAAGEQTASDDAPVAVAPAASDDEEEGEEGEEEAPEPLRELEAAGEKSASDHAPVAPAAAEDEEGGGVAVEEEGGEEGGGDATEQDEEGEGEDDGEDVDAQTHLPSAPTDEESIICNDLREECGRIMRDLVASEPQAELMIDNVVLEVLLEHLRVTDSFRAKELCLRIMGNLACYETLVDAICLEKALIATVLEQLFLDDVYCLTETFRLLASILRSHASLSLAEALSSCDILSRILWILGNKVNSTLLEKILDFLSTITDDQDVSAILIQPLLTVGLVDHITILLTNEIERSPDGKLERSGFVDVVLQIIDKLSAIYSVEVMSSASYDRLIKVLLSIKEPDELKLYPQDCAEMNPNTPMVITTRKSFIKCSPEVGPAANISSNLEGKQCRSNINCLSTPRKRIVSIALLLLIMMGWTILTSSGASPTCDVTSLATNVRLFCTANQPSSSCCESLRAAAMSYGRHRCLCLLGSSPDVMMIGFSPENLMSLYGLCTGHDYGFSCEEAVTDETHRGERMPRHGRPNDMEDNEHGRDEPQEEDETDWDFEDDQHAKDEAQEEGETDRGVRMPRGREPDFEDNKHGRDEPEEEDQRSHHERMHRHGRPHDFEDDWQETETHGSKQDEDQQKETGHPKKQQRDSDSQSRSHSGSVISMLACLLVLAVGFLLGVGFALRYKHRHGINIRQLLYLAAAAALPAFAPQGRLPAFAPQARLPAPVGLPLEQPTPATPALVDGVPGAQVQETRLAFFPGPVEVVSLVLYIVLDKMRRSLRA